MRVWRKCVSLMAATFAVFAAMFGLTWLTTPTATAVTSDALENKIMFYDSTEPETNVVYYAADCSKTELFRMSEAEVVVPLINDVIVVDDAPKVTFYEGRPAAGALLPGEEGYEHISTIVVRFEDDGTKIFENSIILHPDGSTEYPMGYEDPVDRGDQIVSYKAEGSYWNEITDQYEIRWNYIFVDWKVPPTEEQYPEPVPEPDPEPEPTPDDDTDDWGSSVVVERWSDGTKIYNDGLIIHPNGVYHTPAGWVEVDGDGVRHEIGVFFDEETGEWEPVYVDWFPSPEPIWKADEAEAGEELVPPVAYPEPEESMDESEMTASEQVEQAAEELSEQVEQPETTETDESAEVEVPVTDEMAQLD